MASQSPLNVVLEVRPGAEPALRAELERLGADPGNNDALPFARLHGVHFARLVLLPRANRRVGRSFPPRLVLACNVDGDDVECLRALVDAAGAGLGRLLQHCRDAPAQGDDRAAVFAYLERHRASVGALYVNTIGRQADVVGFEAKLVRELQERLDEEPSWRGRTPEQVRAALIEFVAGREDLRPALEPAPEPSRLSRLLGYARLGLLVLALLTLAILLLPVTVIATVVGVLALRGHEIGNRPDNRVPRDEHVRALEQDEDHGVQNQLSAVGVLQPGPFRLLIVLVALVGLQLAARHYFNRGKLAEIDTIHFARWVLIDGGRRLYFFSNYDGSAESYQDDFIERVAFGLNLVFSNGSGWPRTRYLLFGGASDEQAFKAYYRDHQIPTQVWYAAPGYRGLSAVNVANNAEIRRGLHGTLSADQCRRWLLRF